MSLPLPSAAEWADRLGLKRAGREWCGPCPVCGGQDRFHVGRRLDHTALVGCRGCIDGGTPGERGQAFGQVLRAAFPDRSPGGGLLIGGQVGSRNRPTRRTPLPGHKSVAPQIGRRLSSRAAVLWERAVVADDTPAATYLVERFVWPPAFLGVLLPLDCRWIPAERWPASRVTQIPQLPSHAAGALIFAYRDSQRLLRAVSCEALGTDGRRCEPRWRRTFGTKVGAWFVTGPGPRCYVEGECDALAARWLKPGLAGAACGGDAGARALKLPKGGSGAWLLPDGDDAGYDAAVLAHANNPRLTVAWRDNDGGDPAADLCELIEERVAIGMAEGLAEAASLQEAWRCLMPGQVAI